MTEDVEYSGQRGAPELEGGLEALRQNSAFRGPIEPLDGHGHSNDHLALVYESREEQFEAVIPFVRQGLERGERCLYIADENSRAEVLEALRDAGVDAEAALESGALQICTVHETYLKGGEFDLEESLALLEDALEEGTTDFDGFRVTAEETWLLGEDSATEDFMALEARVNDLFCREDCIALCQYNSERFPPDVIRDVIRTHPHLVQDNSVDRNVYYTPPGDFLGSEDPASEVDRMRETLRERTGIERDHQRVAEALEAAQEGISLLDDDGEFIYVNDAYADVFGYDPEEMIGEHWDALGIEADPGYVYDEVLPTIEREGQWTGTTTCVRSDGSTFLAQHSITQTERAELICVVRDVTEREERERELRRTTDRFEAVFEHSSDAIFISDPHRDEIVDANPAGLELLGYDREELLSLGPSDCHPGEAEQFRAFADSVFEDGHGWTDELSCRRKGGEDIPVEISASTVELEDRELLLAVVRDVTERKKHERYQRELYEISADTGLSLDKKLDRLLDLGRERFGLDVGLLTREEGEGFRIVRAQGAPDVEDAIATITPCSGQYCRKSMAADRPVAVPDTEAAGWDDDPLYRELGLGCYIGVSVSVDNEVYGTLCFAGSAPREEPFTDAERAFLELLDQWVSYELERDNREDQLAALNEMSRDLMDAERKDEIAEVVVEHARETLGLPLTATVAYDGQTGTLSPVAQTPRAEEELLTAALCECDAGPLWEAFVDDEIRTLGGVAALPGAGEDVTEVVVVPIDREGLLTTATTAAGGFSSAERDFIEATAATVRAAYTRADREQQLHEREEILEEQNETLARLNRINDTIRNTDQALVQASTREEIERVVCEHLANVGPYELAWIGEYDPVTDEISPRERAGTEQGYLEAVTDGGDEPAGQTPGGRAAETREPQVVNNVLTDPSFEPWRQAALNRGYHACIALPLVYEETLYGVLGVYAGQPGVFDELEQSVLAETADTIAYAINAVESKKAIVSDEVTRLEFSVVDTDLAIMELARELDCEVAMENLVSRSDGGLRVFFSTRGAPAEEVLAFAPRLAVTDLRLVSEYGAGDEPFGLFDALLGDRSLCATVIEHGGRPIEITAADDTATVTIEVAADAAVREFVEMFRTRYPDAELVAQRNHERPQQTPAEFFTGVIEELTARQLEALQTAYFGGYFEEPRAQTASEIASTMGIAQSTFNSHLRAAHRKLCNQLFEEDSLLA